MLLHLKRIIFFILSKHIFRLLTSFFFIVFVFFAINTNSFGDFLSKIDIRFWYAIAVAQPILILSLVFHGTRLSGMVQLPPIPIKYGFKATILYLGLNMILPGKLAEVLKATYLRNQSGITLTQGFAGIFLGIIIDIIIFALLVIFCFIVSQEFIINNENKLIFFILAIISIFFLLIFPLLLKLINITQIKKYLLHIPIFNDILIQLTLHASEQYSFYRLSYSLILSILGWFFYFLTTVVILQLLGQINLTLFQMLLLFITMLAGAMITVLPGGLVTQEAGIIIFLMGLGVNFETSLFIAASLRIGYILSPIILTCLILIKENIGIIELIDDLKNAKKELKRLFNL